MLKNAPDTYLEHLSILFKECYLQNKTPSIWKKGITTLLPKPDSPPNPLGFRPITLLCVEYKLYSHILTQTLLTWLLKFNIIPKAQNGGLPDRGCDTCLWALISTIYAINENSHPMHLIYIDFCKAFDSVEHWVIEDILNHINAGKLG